MIDKTTPVQIASNELGNGSRANPLFMKSPIPPPATKVAIAAIPTVNIAATLIPAKITGQARGNSILKSI